MMFSQSAKTEINTKLSFNPIMQDKKNGKLRFYGAPSMINYGAIPQTWENPHKTELTDIGSFCGDDDPLDIMDFSYLPHQLGDIYQVKVFGAIALIDQGEMDWKILGVNVEDPICAQLRDYCDFFEHFHSDLDKMRQWLRTYKMVDGKGENKLAFDGIVVFVVALNVAVPGRRCVGHGDCSEPSGMGEVAERRGGSREALFRSKSS